MCIYITYIQWRHKYKEKYEDIYWASGNYKSLFFLKHRGGIQGKEGFQNQGRKPGRLWKAAVPT